MEKSKVIINEGGNGLTFEDRNKHNRPLVQDIEFKEDDDTEPLIAIYSNNGIAHFYKEDIDDIISLLLEAKKTNYTIDN